jgi:outer membrane protein TolC
MTQPNAFWIGPGLLLRVILAVASGAARLAAQDTPVGAGGVLTLDEALGLAGVHNRRAEQADLRVRRAEDAIRVAKGQRMPSLKLSTTAGMLLSQPTFSFQRGAFGEYPAVGPIPGAATEIRSERQPAALVTGELALPLTQQYRIGLGIGILELEKKVAIAQARQTRHEVAREVRQAYSSVLQAQNSIRAAEQNLGLQKELYAQSAHKVRVGAALEGEMLAAKARIAGAESDLAAVQGLLATEKERLNQLLGRAIDTEFGVVAAVDDGWIPDLGEARARALAARPEVEQARLRLEQADLDRRKKQSEFLPDISLSVTYYAAFNVSGSLPRNVTIAGVQATWDPFEWRRRRREVSQKEASLAETALALKDTEDLVRIEVGTAHRQLQEARAALIASRAFEDSTLEATRLVIARFRADAALASEVLQAQAELETVRERTGKALQAYWSARAELERAMGEGQ